MPRLAELKAEAQRHYDEPLEWHDTPWGHSWADVDHHTVSVLVQPPAGTPHIAVIRDGTQAPLVVTLDTAYQLAMKL